MIRPLRQRHRVMICALGVLLPVAFTAGIVARKPIPAAATVPAGLAGAANDFGAAVWTQEDVWPNQRITTSLRLDAAGSVAVGLIFRDLVKPDVLVYWTAGAGTRVEALPDNAQLLGALSNRASLPIPPDALGGAGRFVLYSLADHEVVAVSRPLRL